MPVIRPKKTYQANPFPTTAANGQQGAYGAMLPTAPVAGLQRGGSPALGANTSAGSVTTTRGTFGQVVNNPVPVSQPVLPPKKEAGSSNVQRQMTPMDSILSALTMGKVDNFNEVLRLNSTPSTARGTYGQTAGATTTPASTSVFIPKASTFDYQANVMERNAAALSMMQPTPENPNGQWPKQLSSQDAQALGIGQMLIDAGYQMYGGNLVAPSTLTTPTTTTSNFGNYAEGNKLYSGQAKTAQEAFQQGTYKPSKRWWIGRGKTHGETAVAAPQTNQTTSGFTGQIGLVNFNTGT